MLSWRKKDLATAASSHQIRINLYPIAELQATDTRKEQKFGRLSKRTVQHEDFWALSGNPLAPGPRREDLAEASKNSLARESTEHRWLGAKK